jgi:hypothetical protein
VLKILNIPRVIRGGDMRNQEIGLNQAAYYNVPTFSKGGPSPIITVESDLEIKSAIKIVGNLIIVKPT